MRVSIAKSIIAVLLLATASPGMAASGDPYALSDAVLIDFTFTAPAGVTPKYFGGDVEDCLFIGDAGCDLKVDQVNFGTMSEPSGYLYSIRHEYAGRRSGSSAKLLSCVFQADKLFHVRQCQ